VNTPVPIVSISDHLSSAWADDRQAKLRNTDGQERHKEKVNVAAWPRKRIFVDECGIRLGWKFTTTNLVVASDYYSIALMEFWDLTVTGMLQFSNQKRPKVSELLLSEHLKKISSRVHGLSYSVIMAAKKAADVIAMRGQTVKCSFFKN